LTFDATGWLILLVALPAAVVVQPSQHFGVGASAKMDCPWALRTGVLVLLVLAIAEMQWVHTSQKLAVIYLLDQSVSIPDEQRRAMADYVNAAIKSIGVLRATILAGVIIFGR